jgi:hypothetical protein
MAGVLARYDDEKAEPCVASLTCTYAYTRVGCPTVIDLIKCFTGAGLKKDNRMK